MHPDMVSMKCTIMRGGTSKGIYIMENQLPKDTIKKNKVIRAIFGSPDIRQIDGLGGADVLTSKLAIIGPPSRNDADVDYTFAQVSINDEVVDFKSNCGNISAGVGPYAIDHGLVRAMEPITTVRIHQKNTGRIIVAEVEVKDGKSRVEGDCQIDGVPGTGSRIKLDFSDSIGALTGKLLPTGNVRDEIELENGEKYMVSIVDVAIPVVFIKARDLGLKGIETPQEIEQNRELMEKIEEIRGNAAVKMGLVKRWDLAIKESTYSPFLSIISPAIDYLTFNGINVKAQDIDFISRLIFMQKVHKAHPVTGTVCAGVAAKISDTIVWEVLKERSNDNKKLMIGHPSGVIPIECDVEMRDSEIVLKKAAIYRTARLIMEGDVYIRKSLIE